MNTSATQNITILHDAKEWSTDLDGEIGEIRVDGKRLNDIHDMATKIDKMTSVIKVLALIAMFLAILAVGGMGYIGFWLAINKEQIANTMNATEDRFSRRIGQLHNSNAIMGEKLRSLGWHWRDEGWQQIGNSTQKVSK